jgi:magnesium-transporting ATPase (P-type)
MRLLIGGLTTGAVAFTAFLLGYGDDQATGQTMAFVTLVLAQLAYVFAVRADGWPPVAGRNRFLYLAVAGSALFVAVLLVARPLHETFDVVELEAAQLLSVAALAMFPFACLTSFDTWQRRKARRLSPSPPRPD